MGKEAWGELQDIDTATYSEALGYDDEQMQMRMERLCEWFRRLRAEERCETLRCVARRVYQLRTTPRRRAATDRKCRRRLLPGVRSAGEPGVCSRGPALPRWAWAKFAMQAAVGIESTRLVALRKDGDRCTHIVPFTLPLCGQSQLFLGTWPPLKHLPEPKDAKNGPGASTPWLMPLG